MKFFAFMSALAAFAFAGCTTPGSAVSGGKNIEVENTTEPQQTSALYLPMP